MFNPSRLISTNLATYNHKIPKRYKSSLQFDLLYCHIKSKKNGPAVISSDGNIEKTSFLLATYLAHWGMFRGSSQLKDTNAYFFQDLIVASFNSRDGIMNPLFSFTFDDLHRIDKSLLAASINRMKEYLAKNGVAPTGTLVSKIYLGLLGNMPAYDRVFVNGLRRLKAEKEFIGPHSFGVSSLVKLSEFCLSKKWPRIPSDVSRRCMLPKGRLVDLAIHRYGSSGLSGTS